MKFWKITSAVFALALSSSANAALIDNGDITTDTISGFEWLDVTLTAGKSYDYVSSQFGAGGQFEGWRYASSAELSGFFDSAGGSGEYIGYDPSHHSIVPDIMNMWGTLTVYSANTTTIAMLADSPADGLHYYASIYEFYSYVNRDDYINLFEGSWDDTRTNTGISSALVRASVVPVPAAVWLFGSGLIGLIGVARRRAHA